MSTVKMTKTSTVTESTGPGSTTIKTQYSSGGDYEGRQYKAAISTRPPLIVQRSSFGAPGGGRQSSRQVSYGYGGGMGAGPAAGAYANISAVGVTTVKTSREREKRDMQDLNERFASYIEKVRFLEAQNRKLSDELDHLKKQWGRETASVKTMYQVELDEARKLLDEVEKEKARLEIRNASLEEQLVELRNKLDELTELARTRQETIENQYGQLSEYESEINLLRRRIGSLEAQRDKDKKEIDRLTDALNRARIDLDNESLLHIQAENQVQTLEEELEFLKGVHDQEMKEMAALAYRDTTKENRDFWKNELGQALREIQEVYDGKLETMRGELEQYYNLKIQEFRTGSTRQGMETQHAKEESKRLRTQLTDMRSKLADLEARNAQLEKECELLRREYEEKEREFESENGELKSEVAKLRAEMEAILKELQNLMDTKLGLELEIAAYRKLLEGEENRSGLRSIVETMMTSGGSFGHSEDGDSSLRMSQVVKGEMQAKTTYQRSAKGPISIHECSADGNYICLENTGKKDEILDNYKIQRIVDGKKEINFIIKKLTLGSTKQNSKAKIYAYGKRDKKEENIITLECTIDEINSWGIGANITTKLLNGDGEERATHLQKTSYT